MDSKKIAFVVHRYYPYPGGSENNVRAMAETMVDLGHDVTVWSPTNMGDQNGVKVTDDPNHLFNKDLVILHGAGPGPQNFIINHIKVINSPFMYMIVKPEQSEFHLRAAADSKWIAASTFEDYDFVYQHNLQEKTINFRYGLLPSLIHGQKTFRDRFNLPKDKKMFLSCGGYWPHKGMNELVDIFNHLDLNNSFLVTTGYHDGGNKPKDSDNVYNIMLEDKQHVLDAMADADYYVLNSYEEGYGLVLVESMFNGLPWIARNIAAAKLFEGRGAVFDNADQLKNLLLNASNLNFNIEDNKDYVEQNHTAKVMVRDLLKVLQ